MKKVSTLISADYTQKKVWEKCVNLNEILNHMMGLWAQRGRNRQYLIINLQQDKMTTLKKYIGWLIVGSYNELAAKSVQR